LAGPRLQKWKFVQERNTVVANRNLEMDIVNQEIIATLKQNGRITWGELASQIGISRQALRKRVERLEHKGEIIGYTIVTAHKDDNVEQNKSVVRAFLKIRFAKGNDCFKLARAMSSCQNIAGSWAITGDWDMMALVEAASMEKISEIREMFVSTGGIDEIETDAVLNHLNGASV
jgi:DNA-binding Lrp family transcriptional regulator